MHKTEKRRKVRLGVLASGRGTNLQAIIDASERGDLDAEVAVVISDQEAAPALERARKHGLEAIWVDPRSFDSRRAHDARVVEALRDHQVDLVVLAGYMRLLAPVVLEAFPGRIMNIHPALLPSFPGRDGLTPALDYGVKISGCTVHFVDEGIDSGPVILQAAVPVREGDTRETLAARIQEEEHRLYPRAIQLFAEGRLKIVDDRRVEIRPQEATAEPAGTTESGKGPRTGTRRRRRRRALLSVYDKTGLEDFARGLVRAGYELVSSGGTARAIRDAGLPVTPVEEITGSPEMLDGRVKTLHPVVHGGILARRDLAEHLEQLDRRGIVPIDLVAVNLYPFQATVNRGAPFHEVIENIDIGGPTLIRSAAKNHDSVSVVTDPAQYDLVLGHLSEEGEVPPEVRRDLALAAFRSTAFYDSLISDYLTEMVKSEHEATPFPEKLTLGLEKVSDLRYGENPHQAAAFYRHPLRPVLDRLGATLPGARQLQGKELSYNNLADAEAALRAVEEFAGSPAAVVALKHMNPCGAAVADDILTAYRRAFASDPVSIYGGIVALTRPVEVDTAREMVDIFLEVVMAPGFTPEALEILAAKPNIRLLALPIGTVTPVEGPASARGSAFLEAKTVAGGLLVQTPDVIDVPPEKWRAVTEREPSESELRDLFFAWRVCKHVKSNAITVARNGQLLGVGAGQMNRIDATRLAVGHADQFADEAAGRPGARGAVLASDAYFPFPDSVEAAAAAGITAIVQPGGSRRDEESVAACDKAGLAMVYTGERHFRH